MGHMLLLSDQRWRSGAARLAARISGCAAGLEIAMTGMNVSVVVGATTSQHDCESGRNCRILQMPFLVSRHQKESCAMTGRFRTTWFCRIHPRTELERDGR
ncbi:hypothetical protein A6U87_20290 [Rhizobium sp. AC44/96]|nr:hypothetical protein A6U87_20290 [Rhizobium sp. AC44/96]